MSFLWAVETPPTWYALQYEWHLKIAISQEAKFMKISALFIKMRYAPIADFGASSPNRTINSLWKSLLGNPAREIRIASITPAQRSCSTTMPIVNASFDLIAFGLMHRTYWTLVAPMVSINWESCVLNFVDTVCCIKEPFFFPPDEVQCGRKRCKEREYNIYEIWGRMPSLLKTRLLRQRQLRPPWLYYQTDSIQVQRC